MFNLATAAALATLAAPALGILAASPWAEAYGQSNRCWYWAGICAACGALPADGRTLLMAVLG